MARALAAVGAALVFLLLVLGVVVYVNRDEDAIAVDNLLAENISREIGTAEQRGADADLADVTDFKWDHVLVAERSASRAAISKALGAPWKGEVAFGTGDLLIFVRGRHVARYAGDQFSIESRRIAATSSSEGSRGETTSRRCCFIAPSTSASMSPSS